MGGHTPGPWMVSEIDEGVSNCGEGLAVDEPDGGEVCSVWGQQYWTDVDEQVYANARLIAAAPELLGALQNLVAECDHGDGAIYCPGDLEEARAAIAKATGAIASPPPAPHT